jgi:hypothetical protein
MNNQTRRGTVPRRRVQPCDRCYAPLPLGNGADRLMLLRRTVGANFRRSTGGNRPANFVMAGLVPRAFTHGFSRLGKNAGTSSFRGAGSAREPGIQEHGREKSKARPVFMGSGPGPDRPSRNDTRVFQQLVHAIRLWVASCKFPTGYLREGKSPRAKLAQLREEIFWQICHRRALDQRCRIRASVTITSIGMSKDCGKIVSICDISKPTPIASGRGAKAAKVRSK